MYENLAAVPTVGTVGEAWLFQIKSWNTWMIPVKFWRFYEARMSPKFIYDERKLFLINIMV